MCRSRSIIRIPQGLPCKAQHIHTGISHIPQKKDGGFSFGYGLGGCGDTFGVAVAYGPNASGAFVRRGIKAFVVLYCGEKRRGVELCDIKQDGYNDTSYQKKLEFPVFRSTSRVYTGSLP